MSAQWERDETSSKLALPSVRLVAYGDLVDRPGWAWQMVGFCFGSGLAPTRAEAETAAVAAALAHLESELAALKGAA